MGTIVSELETTKRGFAFDYAYDPIGNRTSATEYDESGAPLFEAYAANELNQYTQRTVPGYAAVRGEADTNAFVTVNERPVARTGAYFHGGDYADNTASNVYADLEIYAAINPPGTNTPDTVYAVTSQVFVAKTPEQFTYDADGNMTGDGRFTYIWNAENRMVMASNAEVCVTYAYDHRGRMVRKDISRRDAEPQSIAYTWDGWNIIRETLVTRHSSLVTHNVWGLDLDGTLQGAGGVGGLLAVIRDDGVYLPAYDANGNITEYVSTNGEVVAHYDYSPFGDQLVASGPLADSFTHRFSTKPYCPVTGFSEYQMRKYRPDIGRWMSRDSWGEDGGVSLSTWCANDGNNLFDILGLVPIEWGTKPKLSIEEAFAKRMLNSYGKPCDGCCDRGSIQLRIAGRSYQSTVYGNAQMIIENSCQEGVYSCECVINPEIYWWDCYSKKWTNTDFYIKEADPGGLRWLPLPPDLLPIQSDPLHLAMIAAVLYESCENGHLVTRMVYSDNMLIWGWDFHNQAWDSSPKSTQMANEEVSL